MPIGYSPIAHGVASSAVYKHPATRCLVRSALVASTSCSAQRSFTPPENTRPISSFRVATVQNMGHHRGRRAQGLSLPPGWPPAGTRGPTAAIEPKAYSCRPGDHRPEQRQHRSRRAQVLSRAPTDQRQAPMSQSLYVLPLAMRPFMCPMLVCSHHPGH